MSERGLEAWCFGELAGTLSETASGLAFAYADGWAVSRPPLSQSLPLSGDFDDRAASAFFGGLLPEGNPREVLARQLGVSRDNDFSLLAAIGGDTAGAISLVRPGAGAPDEELADDVSWLNERELAEEIRQLPSRPMHADDDGEYRLSLAGAQDKLPVVVARDGRVGLTRGKAPSTHIMKTPIPNLEHTVANEAMCLDLGRRLGIATVEAVPRRVLDTECLLVTRYDRERHAGGVVSRLHQEDFCQALGISSIRKYQAEGGPGLADCFGLIRSASTVPARDAVRMLDYLVLSFLVANHDAHGKNYSLVYGRQGTDVAPAYDVLCTFVYRGALRMSRKMAMSIGKEYRPEYVRARHFDALLEEARLGPAAARRRIADLAAAAPAHAADAHAALAADGWDAPVLGRIAATVSLRATWLAAHGGPGAARRAAAIAARPEPDSTTRTELLHGIDAGETMAHALEHIFGALSELTPLVDAGVSTPLGADQAALVDDVATRVDNAVDVVLVQLKVFTRGLWRFIGEVDAGRSPAAREPLGPQFRKVAALLQMTIASASNVATLADRLDDAHPDFGRLAAGLERFSEAGPTIAEWDARLESLGVPLPTTE